MLTDPEMRATCAVYIDELCSDMTVVHLPPSVRRAAAGFSLYMCIYCHLRVIFTLYIVINSAR